MDTSTQAGRDKRTEEFIDSYERSGNRRGLVRLIGGSINDFGDAILRVREFEREPEAHFMALMVKGDEVYVARLLAVSDHGDVQGMECAQQCDGLIRDG